MGYRKGNIQYVCTEPANESDKQPRGKFIGAFRQALAVVACRMFDKEK